jgi:hypothetical protein
MGFSLNLDHLPKVLAFLLLASGLALPSGAGAGESIAGVCPDGSAFVVHQKQDIPCKRAKLVEPGSIPPLRPELLPRPYPWMVDQEARNPNNPYNMIDAAEAIRAARSGEAPEGKAEPPEQAQSAPAPIPQAPTRASVPGLPREELEALVQLIELRQEVAPAVLRAEDALGRGRLEIQFAYSRALELQILQWLGRTPEEARVAIFSIRAIEEGDFDGNLFFLQDSRGFRPDVALPEELGFFVGGLGHQEPGRILLGYVVLPASFAPERPMELFWNDRHIESTLAPQ